MNEHVSSLYVRAHELLNLGMDGSPIYSDHFARLNREVYEQALDLYNTLEGNTPEAVSYRDLSRRTRILV